MLAQISLTAALLAGACSNSSKSFSGEKRAAGEDEQTEDAKFSTIKVLEIDSFELLIAPAKKMTIQGPVGFFSVAQKEHQYRILAVDGDGLGGVAFDTSGEAELLDALRKSTEAKTFLWVVVRGEIRQFDTMDSMNREFMPDAFFTSSRVLGFFEKPTHQYPRAGITK